MQNTKHIQFKGKLLTITRKMNGGYMMAFGIMPNLESFSIGPTLNFESMDDIMEFLNDLLT